MYDIYLLMIDILFTVFLIDPDTESKQHLFTLVLKVFLERMTYHLKIPFILSQNIPEYLEYSGFLLKYLCLVKRTLWKLQGF